MDDDATRIKALEDRALSDVRARAAENSARLGELDKQVRAHGEAFASLGGAGKMGALLWPLFFAIVTGVAGTIGHLYIGQQSIEDRVGSTRESLERVSAQEKELSRGIQRDLARMEGQIRTLEERLNQIRETVYRKHGEPGLAPTREGE